MILKIVHNVIHIYESSMRIVGMDVQTKNGGAAVPNGSKAGESKKKNWWPEDMLSLMFIEVKVKI